MSGTFTISTPFTAKSFLNTLGVDTHIPYTDGTYSNLQTVISDLQYLGITQVRDGITNGQNGSAPISSYITLAQAGIKFTFVMEVSSTADLTAELSLINQVEAAVPGSVTSIEGPNEINNEPLTYNGVSGFQGALNAQAAIYSAVHSDSFLVGVPVDYFTGYDASGLPVGPDPSTTPGLADYDTGHPYPNNGQAPAAYVARPNSLPNETSLTAPAVFTETGYSTNQVSADVQAKYELDLFMDTAAEGIAKTYLYELLDAYAPGSRQGDDGFGLFDYTNAPKEVANAIHSLTTLLQDNGANAASFSPSAVTYTVAGLPSSGNSLAIEMSDGSKIISVWNEPQIWNSNTQSETTVASIPVTVSLGATYASVQVYDPLDGTSPIATYSNVSSVTIGVTDHPVLVKFSPTVVAPPPTTGTLMLNVTETPASGVTPQFTVSVDGTQIGGVQTATALRSSGASQDITLAGNFSSGPHQVAITYLNGFTGNPADAGRMLYVNAITLDNATIFPNGQYGGDGTTTYTVQVPSPVAASNAGTTDTLVLNLSEAAMSGQDARFLVSVDGQIVDDVQTVTALQSSGQSQNVTLTGNFGSGSHIVTVDFVNGFSGNPMDAGRELFINSITLDGKTTTENTTLQNVGSQSFQVVAGTQTQPGTTLPTVSITSQVLASDTGASSTDDITSNGAVTLTGTLTGAAGSTVAIYNGSTSLGAAVVSNGNWSFTTTLPQGVYALYAVVTDPSSNTAKTAAEPTITVETTPPSVAITTPSETLTAIGSTAAVTLTGTVASGLSGSSVQVKDGTTVLGTATVSGGSWSYAASLAVGSHSITAIATDLAGNTTTSAADAITVISSGVTLPTVSITSQVLASDTGASSTDDITSNGAVTLTGTLTGAAGSTVAIYNGTTSLGAAVVSNGNWSFTTTLPQGVYALYAVMTDPSSNTAKTAAEPTITVETTPPSVAITTPSETLTATGSTAAVTLTGTVASGLTGSSVQVKDGTTVLGTATVSGGSWSYAASLAIGSHSITAIATDLAGNTTTSAADAITVVAPPPTTGTLVLNVTETPASGVTPQFTVSVDGTQIGGVQTATALRSSGASQDITLAGNFSSGPHQVAITYLNGFTGNPADAGRMLYVNAITLDNATIFPNGQYGGDGTTTYTVQVPSPVAASNAGTTDTLVLNLSEAAMSGQDARFLVSVDGQIVDDVQTVTALQSSGQSQNVTLTGNFGSGSHIVTVDFVNGFSGNPMDAGRELFINSITLDGKTTTENTTLQNVGSQSFQVVAGTQTQPGTTLPTVSITSQVLASDTGASSTDDITSNGAVTLTGTLTGAAGSTVAIYNGTTSLGAAVVSNGNWSFTTTLPQGVYALYAVVTDPSSNTAKTAAEPTVTVETTPPSVAITTPSETLTAIGSTAAVTLTGTVASGLSGSSVQVKDGTTVLGTATVSGGSWSYAASLAVGSHSITAIATDLAGNTTTSAADAITVISSGVTLPTVSITSQVLASDTGASSTDDITSNGAVTLTGTLTGAAGSTVAIYNGTTSLGAAVVSNGNWSFTTTLPQGVYALYAVMTDPSSNTAKTAAEPTITVETTPPSVAITTPSETLTATGSTAAVTLTGTVASGLTGSSVQVKDGTTVLGTATVSGGSWSYAASLAIGSHSITAIATDLAGNTTTSGSDAITVVAPPPTTGTLVLNVTETPASGVTPQFTVSVDGTQIGGVQTATALRSSGASQDITLAGNFSSGPHQVAITYLNGFTGNPADAGRMLYVNAITLDNATIFPNGQYGGDGTTTYTVQVPQPVAASNAGTTDTLVLNLSEAAMSGQDARFLVSVDGQIVDDVQTVTALQSSGQSQNVTLTGNFGSGSHIVTVNFVNGFSGNPMDAGRELFINSITLDGKTTTENTTLQNVGSQSFQVVAGTQTSASTSAIAMTATVANNPQTVTYAAGQGALDINTGNPAGVVLNLGAGLSPANVSLTAGANGALDITDSVTGDVVTIERMLDGLGDGVSQMTFIDGTTWTAAQMSFAATDVTPGSDTIYGTTGDDVIDGRGVATTIYGEGGNDTYLFRAGYGALQIDNAAATQTAPSGQLDFGTGLTKNNLWFSQSGSDLDVTVLGSQDEVIIKGWFGGDPSASLADFVGGDGLRLDSGLPLLVSAMAAYQAGNPGFNPSTALSMPTNSALQSAIQSAWHA